MQFHTLESLSLSELANLFNRAFADYFVKIELTAEMLQEKIISENILLNHSVGTFVNGKPVGFIFHAVREIDGTKCAYNAGTGVIPEFRGKKSTSKMYDFILPLLKENGVETIFLEVMEENIPAIKSYKKAGFKKAVNLECFNGSVKSETTNKNILIKKCNKADYSKHKDFWDWKPTWQHFTETIQNSSVYETFYAYLNNKWVAYIIINPKTGRIAQFAVKPDFRRQGIGKALFQHVSTLCTNGITIINVDGNSISTLSFLKSLGLNHFLTQHKMALNINSIK